MIPSSCDAPSQVAAERAGHIATSPFRTVKPAGRPSTGKPQLRIEEATRFVAAAV